MAEKRAIPRKQRVFFIGLYYLRLLFGTDGRSTPPYLLKPRAGREPSDYFGETIVSDRQGSLTIVKRIAFFDVARQQAETFAVFVDRCRSLIRQYCRIDDRFL
jgi:hypothetical protein